MYLMVKVSQVTETWDTQTPKPVFNDYKGLQRFFPKNWFYAEDRSCYN